MKIIPNPGTMAIRAIRIWLYIYVLAFLFIASTQAAVRVVQ